MCYYRIFRLCCGLFLICYINDFVYCSVRLTSSVLDPNIDINRNQEVNLDNKTRSVNNDTIQEFNDLKLLNNTDANTREVPVEIHNDTRPKFRYKLANKPEPVSVSTKQASSSKSNKKTRSFNFKSLLSRPKLSDADRNREAVDTFLSSGIKVFTSIDTGSSKKNVNRVSDLDITKFAHGYECQFKPGVKCVGVKFKDQVVWKYGNLGFSMYPKILKYNYISIPMITLEFENKSVLSFAYRDGQWKVRLKKLVPSPDSSKSQLNSGDQIPSIDVEGEVEPSGTAQPSVSEDTSSSVPSVTPSAKVEDVISSSVPSTTVEPTKAGDSTSSATEEEPAVSEPPVSGRKRRTYEYTSQDEEDEEETGENGQDSAKVNNLVEGEENEEDNKDSNEEEVKVSSESNQTLLANSALTSTPETVSKQTCSCDTKTLSESDVEVLTMNDSGQTVEDKSKFDVKTNGCSMSYNFGDAKNLVLKVKSEPVWTAGESQFFSPVKMSINVCSKKVWVVLNYNSFKLFDCSDECKLSNTNVREPITFNIEDKKCLKKDSCDTYDDKYSMTYSTNDFHTISSISDGTNVIWTAKNPSEFANMVIYPTTNNSGGHAYVYHLNGKLDHYSKQGKTWSEDKNMYSPEKMKFFTGVDPTGMVPQDKSKEYFRENLGCRIRYLFEGSTKCDKIQYDNQEVWKHSNDPEDPYPKYVSLNVCTNIISIDFMDNWHYDYMFKNNRWNVEYKHRNQKQ